MSTIYTCDKCHKKIKEKKITGMIFNFTIEQKYRNFSFCEKCGKLFLSHLKEFY